MEFYEETNHGEVSEKLVREIAGSLGWMRFISITGLVLLGIGLLGFIAAVLTALSYSSMMGSNETSVIFIGILAYLVFLAIFIYIYVLLLQAASEYGKFVKTKNMANFERAVLLDKRFWQWLSITMIVAFVSLFLFGMILGAMSVRAPSPAMRFR